MRRTASVASIAVILLCAAQAHAMQLEWSAPPECGDGAAFSAALRRELGEREPPGPVRIEVRPRGNAYVLHLELFEGGARRVLFQRDLVAPTCFELRAAALSVLVVSATEHQDASGGEAPDAGPPPAIVPAPETLPPEPSVSQPPPHPLNPVGPRDQPRRSNELGGLSWGIEEAFLGVGAGIESGRVGTFAPRIDGQLRLPLLGVTGWKIGLAAGAIYVPPQRHQVDAEKGGELSRAAGRLGGLLRFERGIAPLSVQLTIQGELARVTGSGYGVSSPATRGVWRSALVADAELGVAVERLNLGIWGELSVAQDDSRYVLEGVGEVYRPAVFAPSGGLRAWLRFP